ILPGVAAELDLLQQPLGAELAKRFINFPQVQVWKILQQLTELLAGILKSLGLQVELDDPYALVGVFRIEGVVQNAAKLVTGDRAGGDPHGPDVGIDALNRFDLRPPRRDLGDALNDFERAFWPLHGKDAVAVLIERVNPQWHADAVNLVASGGNL